MKTAILDLGTNTFNLLIADTSIPNKPTFIYREELPVKLGKGGINNRTILPNAIQRALKTLNYYQTKLQEYHVDKVKAYATSAIRSADNGKYFVDLVKDDIGISIEVIDGNREAELIYYGVRSSLNLVPDKFLILDIGGGSNEFILANKETILWKQSFDLGMARMLEMFIPSNPITNNEINSYINYIDRELYPLYEALKNYGNTKYLIGASGSFETFLNIYKALAHQHWDKNFSSEELLLTDYSIIHEKLINSTTEQRMNLPGLVEMRVDTIVLASIFVNHLIHRLNINHLFVSNYALKEGALFL